MGGRPGNPKVATYLGDCNPRVQAREDNRSGLHACSSPVDLPALSAARSMTRSRASPTPFGIYTALPIRRGAHTLRQDGTRFFAADDAGTNDQPWHPEMIVVPDRLKDALWFALEDHRCNLGGEPHQWPALVATQVHDDRQAIPVAELSPAARSRRQGHRSQGREAGREAAVGEAVAAVDRSRLGRAARPS